AGPVGAADRAGDDGDGPAGGVGAAVIGGRVPGGPANDDALPGLQPVARAGGDDRVRGGRGADRPADGGVLQHRHLAGGIVVAHQDVGLAVAVQVAELHLPGRAGGNRNGRGGQERDARVVAVIAIDLEVVGRRGGDDVGRGVGVDVPHRQRHDVRGAEQGRRVVELEVARGAGVDRHQEAVGAAEHQVGLVVEVEEAHADAGRALQPAGAGVAHLEALQGPEAAGAVARQQVEAIVVDRVGGTADVGRGGADGDGDVEVAVAVE